MSQRIIDNIDIYLLYEPRNGQDRSFFELANQKAGLDSDDYKPSGFWGVGGGLEIAINGYCRIFRSLDFHYLVRTANFLVHSLYWIKGKSSEWFDADDTYPDDVVVRTTGNNVLRIRNFDTNALVLSYVPKDCAYNQARGRYFFDNVVLFKNSWQNASEKALSEYFEIALGIGESAPEDKTSEIIMNHYKIFDAIRCI